MSNYFCSSCIGKYNWSWQEAFLKTDCFPIEMNTCCVAGLLMDAGYQIQVAKQRKHRFIRSIKVSGIEQIPPNVKIGYDNPQDYLPKEIVTFLNKAFSTEWPYPIKNIDFEGVK